MTAEFVRAQECQAEEIHSLFSQVASERIYILRVEAPTIKEIQEGIVRTNEDGGAYLVAIDSDRIIGCSVVSRKKNPGMRHVGILGMFLHPDFRGHGIGTQLLNATLQSCINDGQVWRVELGVYPHNHAALAMYRRAGFQDEGLMLRARVLEEREDDILEMAILLDTQPPNAGEPEAPQEHPERAHSSNVVIVSASMEEASNISRLVDSVAKERRWIAMVSGPEEQFVRTFIQNNLDAGNPHYLAMDGERVVGWIDIVRPPREGRQHIGYLGMGLLPEYRGLGIGTQLLETAVSRAQQEGIRQIHLEVWASNIAGQALYVRNGFKPTTHKQRVRYIDGYEDDLIGMQKMLDV